MGPVYSDETVTMQQWGTKLAAMFFCGLALAPYRDSQ